MAAVQLDQSTDNMWDAHTRLKIDGPLSADGDSCEAWQESAEAGEMDADELFQGIRVLTDQIELMRGWLAQADELVSGQRTDLNRALGL
jgi:hypothetical protein